MTISPPERDAKKAKVVVDKNPVATSTEKWGQPGHFDRTLAKGPKTTTWIWNLHANAHDFDSHTSDLEDVSRKIFSAHFGHLAVVFIWLSGMYFHGARFSNYEAWLTDPLGRWRRFPRDTDHLWSVPNVARCWFYKLLPALRDSYWRSGDGWFDAVRRLVPLP
jgi:hypothetical protein